MIRKPRVLFIHSGTHWGADLMIQTQIMQYLDKNRVEVHVAYNPGTSEHASASLPILQSIPDLRIRPTNLGAPLSQRGKAYIARNLVVGTAPWLAGLAGLAGYIKRNEIDIVHGLHKARDAVPTVTLARLTGAKSVLHMHSKYDRKLSGPMSVWALKHADAVIGVSRWVANSAVEGGCSPSRVHYALNGLDMTTWGVPTDGTGVREEFGIAQDAPLLVSVSRLYAFKGHDLLLQALAAVKQRAPGVRLLVVGGDDPSYTLRGLSYMAELKAQANNLGLSDHVVFTGERSDVKRIMAASDVYTMPSPEEGFGMVFVEAMAMGLPVVALNSTGTPEVVEHGKSGLLAEPGNAQQLADHITTLIADPAMRRGMGQYGRQAVEQRFTATRMADDVAAIYERVLGRV